MHYAMLRNGVLTQGGGNQFSPLSIPSHRATFLATDVSAGAVSAWNELGGTTYTMSQGTPANQPSRAGNGVVFDGSNDWVSRTSGTKLFDFSGNGLTVYVAFSCGPSVKGAFFKNSNLSNAGFAFGVGDGTMDANGANLLFLREGVAWVATALTHNGGGVAEVSITAAPQTSFWMDGVAGNANLSTPFNAAGATPTESLGGYSVAASRYFNGTIFAVSVYATASLSAAERTAIRAYMAARR